MREEREDTTGVSARDRQKLARGIVTAEQREDRDIPRHFPLREGVEKVRVVEQEG